MQTYPQISLKITKSAISDQVFKFLNDSDFSTVVASSRYYTLNGTSRHYLHGYYYRLSDREELFNIIKSGAMFSSRRPISISFDYVKFVEGMLQEDVNVDSGAHTRRYEKGKLKEETHRFKGKLHNEKGPAFVIYGHITANYYYLDGEELTKSFWEKRMLAKLYW